MVAHGCANPQPARPVLLALFMCCTRGTQSGSVDESSACAPYSHDQHHQPRLSLDGRDTPASPTCTQRARFPLDTFIVCADSTRSPAYFVVTEHHGNEMSDHHAFRTPPRIATTRELPAAAPSLWPPLPASQEAMQHMCGAIQSITDSKGIVPTRRTTQSAKTWCGQARRESVCPQV